MLSDGRCVLDSAKRLSRGQGICNTELSEKQRNNIRLPWGQAQSAGLGELGYAPR